jgi:hypothetical protein
MVPRFQLAIPLLLLVHLLACGDGGGGGGTPTARSPDEGQAINDIIDAFEGEGILTGNLFETSAVLLKWGDAIPVMEDFGVQLPEWPDPPPEDAPVWIVTLLAEGTQPAPPGSVNPKRCLELLGISSPNEQVNGLLSAKPSEECP